MKNIFSLLIAVFLISTTAGYAQDFPKLDVSPMDKASFNADAGSVSIYYSRPQLQERSLDKLAPKGEVWRTGANEATTINFSKDATVAGKKVKAGVYSLFTIPGDNNWTIILNSNANQWGAYQYDETLDVLRGTATVTTDKKSIEAFSMAFKKDGSLVMAWGTTRIHIPITFQ